MSELALQKFVASTLRLQARPNVVWYAVPNGEYRSKRTGAKLKAMGVVAGVADFALVLPEGRAAFLELKTAKGRSSPDQRAFRVLCERAAVPYSIAKTPEEATAILFGWGALFVDPLAKRRAA